MDVNNIDTTNLIERTVIVIADRGHVWVGNSYQTDDAWLYLFNVKCIRVWGTTKGLAELLNGPTKETSLDAYMPTLVLANRAVIGIIPCNDAPWAKHLKP